ncbi:hypothetical protein CRYUN_Cryun24cG0118800 [Craigia yunnanensis]
MHITFIYQYHTGIHIYHVEPCTGEVEFANGSKFSFSAEFLRVYSPDANGKIRSIGVEKVISGWCHVGIMSAEPVGNYGVSKEFYSSMKQLAATNPTNLSEILKSMLCLLISSLPTPTPASSQAPFY